MEKIQEYGEETDSLIKEISPTLKDVRDENMMTVRIKKEVNTFAWSTSSYLLEGTPLYRYPRLLAANKSLCHLSK